MLNPFYKVVANQLHDFFEQKAAKKEVGRYFIELPSEEYILNFYTALKSLPEAREFVYRATPSAAPYKTIALYFGEMKYVIATTLNNTHVDFIVTLRNEMSEQKGDWANASIIMISNKKLDSIRGGSLNLTSEGFPLHSSSMIGNLMTMVTGSRLPLHDKEMLKHYLSRRDDVQHYQNVSFLDYEDLLTWINKEQMVEEDYRMINYFPDPDLKKLVETREAMDVKSREYKTIDKEVQKRLQDNLALFEEVSRIRELGNDVDILKERFDSAVGKKLADDTEGITYEQIVKAKEKVEQTKVIAFKSEEAKIWVVENGEKKVLKSVWKMESRLRTYDFVIFVPDYKEGQSIQVRLPFTASTKEEYIKTKYRGITRSSGHSLEVNLDIKDEAIFKQTGYKHENSTKGNYSFRFLILPIEETLLANHRDSFSLNKDGHLVLELEEEGILFGSDSVQEIEVKDREVITDIPETGAKLTFAPDILETETAKIVAQINIKGIVFKVEVEDEALSAPPLNASQLWQRKMQKQASIEYTSLDQRLILNDKPFVTKKEDRPFYEIEERWVENNLTAIRKHISEFHAVNISMPDDLSEKYNAFMAYFKEHKTIPSFVYYNEEVKRLANEYIEAYIKAIDDIEDGKHMAANIRNILYLGTVEEHNKIYMSPFSPLNVAYQLAVVNELAGQEVDRHILSKLNAAYTIPYLVSPVDDIYKPIPNTTQAEWHEFRPRDQVSIGETNKYLAQVVEEKLKQFAIYYNYLFDLTEQTEVIINVINIENDEEILRGIIQWFKNEIVKRKSLQQLPLIKVIRYSQSMSLSAFERFNMIDDADKLTTILDMNCKTTQFDAQDVFQEIQKCLVFIQKQINDPIEYSHLTFYKMLSKEFISTQSVRQAPNALNLNGLYSTPSSKRTEDGGYRSGFGIGDSDYNRSQLTRFALKVNELSANRQNKGTNAYHKEEVLCLHINREDEEFLQSLYDSCIWLVFIDPAVDLEYFQETSDNLVIVHYSDQLSSSSHYDAITVTNKSAQYYKVIMEFLARKGIKMPKGNVEQVIKAFNTFNGEWLLRAVQDAGHDQREKMSVVSAIKYMLIELQKDSTITWVPISIEEIVRVAGNVRLSKKEGVFSHKLIDRKGQMSDDLLMIGVKEQEGQYEMLFYPVEVKIGENSSAVLAKGVQQVTSLAKVLQQELSNTEQFEAKFLRNFFAKLFIANARKMFINAFYPSKNYELDESMLEALVNDDFIVSDSFIKQQNIGAIVSFKKDAHRLMRDKINDVFVLEIPERIAYKAVGLSIEELEKDDFGKIEMIDVLTDEQAIIPPLPTHVKVMGVAEEQMHEKDEVAVTEVAASLEERTSEQKNENVSPVEQSTSENQLATVPLSEKEHGEEKEQEVIADSKDELAEENQQGKTEIETASQEEVKNIESLRPLFGQTHSTGQSIYWEFGHPEMNNRHLVIGGRSGEGKTYFVQSVIKQLAEQGQPCVIIDYSSSYTRNKLDAKFIAALGEKVHERIVYDNKLPINPFLQREFYTDQGFRLEKPYQVAGRVSAIFESVFSFGPQQTNALYTAIKEGIEVYGKDFTLKRMMKQLREVEDITSATLATIVNKLQQFVDIDPFDYEANFTWADYYEKPGQVSIIQFAGFDQDNIKKLMTELLLWDIWYYAQRGDEQHPLPVILDEAQNLSFKEGSPSDKILREGRKFGITAWFATQSFNNFRASELSALENATTSIYFHPVDSDLKIVSSKLLLDKRNQVLIHTLGKGECFVRGKFLTANGLSSQTVKMIKVPPME